MKMVARDLVASRRISLEEALIEIPCFLLDRVASRRVTLEATLVM